MKNNLKKLLINVLLITIFIYIFIYSKNIKNYVLFAINLWINNLIPTILPFLLISKLLIYYGITNYLSQIFGNSISKIFHTSKNSSFIIITSMFTGFPTGSIYIKDLLEKNLISIDEANHLIMFTNFANPLFIISGIGENLLNNKKIGIYIFIIHLLTGLLTGFIFRNKNNTINNNINERKENEKNFITVLIDSIYESFKVLLNMLGIIIFFLMIISLIDTFLGNNTLILIFKGLLEMTTGVTLLSQAKLNIRFKTSIICLLLSFSGISIHFQTKSIIDNTKISYKNYLIGRIVHSILCFSFSFILFNLFFNL